MKDLTQGPILRHLLEMALPIGVGMFVQTLYYIVDLYFVGTLGPTALAGVSSGGNAMFIVVALTQILGVGTVSLISHAVGRKDQSDANWIFNQSLLLSVLFGSITLVGGYAVAPLYLKTLTADAETVAAGLTYLHWFIPCMALQFGLIAMGSALRGTGIVQPTILVQVLTVGINIALTPILVAGWLTGRPMGVAGAGLASTLSVGAGVLMLTFYFLRLEKYVSFDASRMLPRIVLWKRMLSIGIPAGGEFLLMFIYIAVVYRAIREFGPSAQAGFGVGSRVMQSLFLPAMAISFAAPAVAGQNFGAKLYPRVRETFQKATGISASIMLILAAACWWQPLWFLRWFSDEPAVLAVATDYLRTIAYGFVLSGIVFSCSGIFQALGNTWPALLSTASRMLTFVPVALWLSSRPDFEIVQLWYVSIATVAIQVFLSLGLIRREFKRKLVPVQVQETI